RWKADREDARSTRIVNEAVAGPPRNASASLADESVVLEEGGDGLRVLDAAVADHLERLVERRAHHVDALALVEVLRRRLEALGEVGVHPLVAHPGRGEELGELREPPGPVARLLLELAGGRVVGVLAGL